MKLGLDPMSSESAMSFSLQPSQPSAAPMTAKGDSIASEVLTVLTSFYPLLSRVRLTIRPLSSNPLTDIGRTIPELRSTILAQRKEFHAISVDERDVLEIYSQCAGFLLQDISERFH